MSSSSPAASPAASAGEPAPGAPSPAGAAGDAAGLDELIEIRSGYDRGSMDPYWNWAHDKSSSKLKVRGRDAPSAHYLRLVSCE